MNTQAFHASVDKKSKIIIVSLGIPLYGRGWRTSATTIGKSATGPSQQGRFTGEAGILSYYEVSRK